MLVTDPNFVASIFYLTIIFNRTTIDLHKRQFIASDKKPNFILLGFGLYPEFFYCKTLLNKY